MVRPALVKLGGSVLTDKAKERTLRKAQAKRLLSEVAKSEVPTVLFHGAGSYGHPAAARAGFGKRSVTRTEDVVETLAGAGLLHAEIVSLAVDAGLEAVSVPLLWQARCEGDHIVGLPVDAVQEILAAGCTPILGGTVLRDRDAWRIVSADELMVAVAHELEARLGLFVTDVDGVYDRDPSSPGARLLERVTTDTPFEVGGPQSPDVSGRMHGKVNRALSLSHACPVLIVNGSIRGRVHDLLRGKSVPATRVTA